ncbi:MAG TPA: DUF4266 domain-containing protein [Xanthomonadales bacterium]|nr:DUF4266 domain-containing protein [Xanthomonadales bacterium]
MPLQDYSARKSIVAGLLGLAMLSLLPACAPVQPWERGRLAEQRMALDGDALLQAMDEHVYSSKEAASGGIEAAGGGCGCN